MLGVIGAMTEEIELLLHELSDAKERVHAGITVTRGNYKDTEIALAQSGVGKVNATICTQMLIDHFSPTKLVFSGVAGGLLPNMRHGDIIIASHVVQYDMDLTAFGRRHGEVPGRDRLIECDPSLVGKATAAFDAAFDGVENAPNLMLGTIASGDRFVQDTKTLRWLQREFAALATEMEGAAFGYNCHLNELPFVVFRALTDSSGDSAGDDFEKKPSSRLPEYLSNIGPVDPARAGRKGARRTPEQKPAVKSTSSRRRGPPPAKKPPDKTHSPIVCGPQQAYAPAP